MNDNLIFYINKLSQIIVAQEFDSEKNEHLEGRNERYFKNCLQKVRQIGCDVLLKKTEETSLEDPCVTDYGGNWSPMTLITDYGRELKSQGALKANDLLLSCISILEEKQFDCINDLLKLLLLLKRPFNKEPAELFQSEISVRGSNFLLDGLDSISILNEDFSSETLSKNSSFKKALHYEESWTKHFDSKFQLLGEFSKKNLLTPDKVSLNSLFSSKAPMINLNQSRTNSFVFTDFLHKKNHKSDKCLFEIYSRFFPSDTPLLDSFVDHPITHKLPSLSLNSKFSSKNGSWKCSNSQVKAVYAGTKGKCSKESNVTCEELKKSSVIELKRNSNCSHSFSTLYKKLANSDHSSLGSNDSRLCLKSKKRQRDSNLVGNSSANSKDIVLGLWEQEQTLLKEFKPEIAADFPLLRMISLNEFIEDIKYLLTGINSGTFQYDLEKNMFKMVFGTCLEDVTPESLLYFSKEFIEIGNCFVKLNSCVTNFGKNNFDTCTTTSQAFWKSIFDYLELHYSLVLEIPNSTNLMSLKSCTRDLHELIMTVAHVCKVFQTKKSLPQGGELLTYLLQVAERMSKQCVINIIFGILQNCCNVYYKCILQNWMFKGDLDSQSNEFFVDYHRQKMKIKSRAYYNSFFVIDERIPSFLRGCEGSIYNCGKSIHFLKLFNPEDKFCQLLDKAESPAMNLCFSEEQLEKFEKGFKNYEDRVLKICGERVTIKTIMDEEKKKEKAYLQYIRECKKAQEELRRETRLKKLEQMREKKQKQCELLAEQWSLIDAEKMRKKQEEEAENFKFEAEMKKVQEKRENLLNREKSLLKCYYDQMMETLKKKKSAAETRKESLRKIILNERKKEDLDIINDNDVQVDNEGNIVSKIDINSNSETLLKVVKAGSELENNADNESQKHSIGGSGYDENSNLNVKMRATPCDEEAALTEVTNEDSQKVLKSVSLWTSTAIEAERNKCKVLRSEFGLSLRSPIKPSEKKPEVKEINQMTALEKNRKKVLESEYNILLKTVEPNYSLSCETLSDEMFQECVSRKDSDSLATFQSFKSGIFQTVSLTRKPECTDLEHPPEKIQESESSDSFLTPPIALNESNTCEELKVLKSPGSSSMLLNGNYQNALLQDTEIFHSKSSRQNIFCSLKEEELDNLPCTDFLNFQRFLKKSVLIPLKVQEKLANDALLKHLLKGENLLSHLNSLRGYFFLNDGEFGRSFTHHAFRSLARCTEPQQFFEKSNLSNIVNEALNYTIHSLEPNAQNLSFRIVKMPPFLNHSSHDVLSPFELSYKVNWPLNIILTEKALSKYKMVFRFLLKLKRINWTLNENFLYLNWHFKSKRLNGKTAVESSHYHKTKIPVECHEGNLLIHQIISIYILSECVDTIIATQKTKRVTIFCLLCDSQSALCIQCVEEIHKNSFLIFIQIFRHAMTQVIKTLDDYIFSNGVQFPWIYFLKDLETTENIDDLYQKHIRYIKDVLTRCFLSKNSEDLLECIHSLLELALKFHYTAKSSAMEVIDGNYVHPKFSVLKSTFNEFCFVIKTFLRTLKEKISLNQIVRSHYVLLEKFDLKLT